MKKGTDFWTGIFRLRQFKIGQIWTDKEQKAALIHYFCIRFHRQLFDSCFFLMKI